MGCCTQNYKPQSDEILIEKLREAIAHDCTDRLKPLLNIIQSPSKQYTIDSPIISTKEITLSPLGYALWVGSVSCFQVLIKEFQASPIEMENSLSENHLSSFDIICERNYLKLFSFYIPIYLKNSINMPVYKQDQNLTLEFDRPLLDKSSKPAYTPIQKACDLGNMAIILTIFNYFKGKDNVPYILDIEYQDDIIGENCVLISCRNGNYAMLKFLHEVVNADFSKKNSKGEGVVVVLLAACRKTPSHNFFQCLVYLIEVVKVDIKDNSEEVLLLAQDKQIVKYLEGYYFGLGLFANKELVEEVNKIYQKPQPKTEMEMKLDEENQEFYVRDFIGEKEYDKSILSSIRDSESQLDPFISVIGANISILK